MTSISSSANLPQAPGSASQAVAPSHSPSASTGGKAITPAAGPASTKSSYANATKSSFSPLNGAAGQHGKVEHNSSASSRIPITPAVPSVVSPTIVNGNTSTSSASSAGEHKRNSSVTISATGAPGYMPNGASGAGKQSTGNNIQFGAMATGGSPAVGNASPQLSSSSDSLAVKPSSNPRVISPNTSPSPIPQPPASGGKPPSALHNHNNSLNFGNFGSPDSNVRPASFSQGPLIPGMQGTHLRRESSHSQHSDMSNHGINANANRPYPQQSGRGRGYGPGYGQQLSYSPAPPYRQPPNQPRSGSVGSFQQQSRQFSPYPNSPHQNPRQPHSPMPPNAQPHPGQPGQLPMQSPHMAQPHYGYMNQYYGYPNGMGPQPVKPSSPSVNDPYPVRQLRRESRPTGPSKPSLDLSPYTGNFEHILTELQQGYAMQQPMAPENAFGANMSYIYQQPPPNMMPPQSPRPINQYPSGPQNPYQGQYPSQPPAMSRTSSTLSAADRPASSMGRPPSSSTPAPNQPAGGKATSSSPAPKTSSFQKPKKSTGIIIKDPTSGEVVDLKHTASPAPSTKSSNSISAEPTPPPAPPAVSTGSADPVHTRSESKTVVKTEGKALREQLARQHREKEEAEVKAAQAKIDEEVRLQKEKADADAKQLEAAAAQMAAEDAKKAAQDEAERAGQSADKAEVTIAEAEKKLDDVEFDEDEIARWEAEEAEQAKKEAEAEAAYNRKKQAEKDEAARKEAEAFQMAEEDMKRAEREAEEAEEARIREKELAQAGGDKSIEGQETPGQMPGTPGIETPADDTPDDSGVATPNSDISSMPPPERKQSASVGRQKPSALKLETHKSVEPPQPSAALMSLRSARKLTSLDIQYPAGKASPNPAINLTAKMGRFRYDRDFLLQFKEAFKEKPTENWSERIRETVGDTGEPQSARGPSRSSAGGPLGGRQPSNRPSQLMPQMGSFGQSARPPAALATSEQRFQASTRAMGGARPPMQNPLANYVSRPGGFPQSTGVKMDRTPSSTSLAHPNSPRNASQRGGSQRGGRGSRREDPKDNKNMPLTAGGNIKPIEVSSTGWKPRSVGAAGMSGPAPGGEGHMTPDVVQRKVKSNLNKMTPNNFNKISDQILAIAHQSKVETDGRSLRQVIQLTFEKATDEAHWAEMYAQFCKRMLESMSPEIKDENILDKKTGEVVVGGALFRKYLLTRCQTEFERGWKVNLPDRPEGVTEEAAMLSDEYYQAAAAKRRGLGLVRFIGELYKLQMLTERIMHECVKKLVDYEGVPDEAEVESLTNLLKTIGQQLDASDKGRSMMDAYFLRINGMIAIKDLPSRLKFMLMDVVDLRTKNHWQQKGGLAVKGPTTIDEVRAQAAEAERQKEAQRAQEAARRGANNSGRPPLGRGDARAFSGGSQFGAPPQDFARPTVGMDDLRRLGSKQNVRQTNTAGQTFGPTSMFASARGSNTRKPLNLSSAQDSGASSRVSTPPAQKEKKDKDKEDSTKSGTNSFSVLATADASGDATSPGTSPALSKVQPAISEVAEGASNDSESGQP